MKLREKFAHLSSPAKASVAYLFVNMFQKGLAFFTSPIYTRLLSPEQYGEVATFFSLIELIGIVAMFCFQGGVFNNGMVDFPDKRDEYSYSMLVLSNVITSITALVVLLGNQVFVSITGLKLYQIILMFLFFYLQPAFGFWTTRQRYEYKYKAVCLLTIILSFLAPFVSIVFILIGNSEHAVFSRILGYELVFFVCYAAFYYILGSKSKWKVNTSYWKPAITFNITLIPHYLSTYVLSSSDRIMVARLASNGEAGIYSLGYSIAAIVLAFWVAVNNSLIPYTYENCKKNNTKAVADVTSIVLFGYGLLCVLVVLLAPEAIRVLAPSSYSEAIYVIPPIVGGVFFQALYNVFANIVYYYKKPKFVMIGSVASAILNIVLNFIFIPFIGYIAAGYTTLICYLLQAMIDYIAMKKVVGKNIYDKRIIILESISIFILSTTSICLYRYSVIRYLLILLIIGFLFLKRNVILNITKSIRNK